MNEICKWMSSVWMAGTEAFITNCIVYARVLYIHIYCICCLHGNMVHHEHTLWAQATMTYIRKLHLFSWWVLCVLYLSMSIYISTIKIYYIQNCVCYFYFFIHPHYEGCKRKFRTIFILFMHNTTMKCTHWRPIVYAYLYPKCIALYILCTYNAMPCAKDGSEDCLV